MGRLGIGIVTVVAVLSLLPFALVARSRASRSATPPLNLIADMDIQPKKKAQAVSPVFADGRAMRPAIEGTVAREDLVLEPERLNDGKNPRMVSDKPVSLSDATTYAAVMLGRIRPGDMTDERFNALKPPVEDQAIASDTAFYVKKIPPQIPLTADFVRRGQERFNIYCGPCHGNSGHGDGPIAVRAKQLQEAPPVADPTAATGWVQPQNLIEPKIRTRSDGHLFNTISNGIRTMPAYDKQISVLDRWAIVAYVRALETSQNEQNSPLSAPKTAPAKP